MVEHICNLALKLQEHLEFKVFFGFILIFGSMWVVTPPTRKSNGPYTGFTHQIAFISDIYIMAHNSSKITFMM